MPNREINLILVFVVGWLIGMATCRLITDLMELVKSF